MAKEKLNHCFGILWFLSSLVVCVTNDIIMKHLGGGYSVFQVVFMRYAFALLSLLPFVAKKRLSGMALLRLPKLHVVRAALLLFAISLYCHALHKLPIATVMLFNFVIPIFTLIFAYAFLKEKISKGSIVATICGFIGICVVFEPKNAKFATLAAVLLLLSSAVFALLDIINKKFVTNEGPLQMVFYTASITFFLSIPFAVLHWVSPSGRDVCLFLVLGVGANLLLYCILKAFEKTTISTVAPLRYLELVLASIAGFVFFGEIPTKATILGSLIIIPSTLHIVLSNSREIKS